MSRGLVFGTVFRSRYAPIVLGAVLLIAAIVHLHSSPSGETLAGAQAAARAGCGQAMAAFTRRESAVWLTLSATVVRILPDSNGALVHQRFLTKCASGLHVLIVNDVSIGQRVPVLAGRALTVHGQYIWNGLGGLIHFTHHAGHGQQNGWILYRNRVYQ